MLRLNPFARLHSIRTTPMAAFVIAMWACSGQPTPTDTGTTNMDGATADSAVDARDVSASDVPVLMPITDCDPLMEGDNACSLPWPSNLYLVADSTRQTGYTLAFGSTSLPQSMNTGRYVSPTAWRRMDGYGVGTPVMVLFPNVDASNLADEYTIDRSLAADAQVLLFEVNGTTLTRLPYFAELDSGETDAARRMLLVRPAVILKESARYVVAFRNLQTLTAAAITPSPAFVSLRDGTTAGNAMLAPRQARFDEVFTMLETAGIPRATLTLAWDFNTASHDALHGRMIEMRDLAIAAAGPQGPPLFVDGVTEYVPVDDGSGRPVNADIAIELTGTFTTPNFTRDRVLPSGRGMLFNLDSNRRLVQNGTRDPRFWVRIPYSALTGTPHGLVLYGHGLLGGGDEVQAGYNGTIANTHNLIFFAADLAGFSTEFALTVLSSLRELSYFEVIADGTHQGIVEWVLLARAMREQLQSLPQLAGRNIVVNRNELFYSGISQGGIFGATFMAVTPDITRGHLGVPGNNYSLLMHRSEDFDRYNFPYSTAYPSRIDQLIGFSLIEQIWEGTDPVSYLRHVTAEPLAGNQPHHVLLAPAKGDHQVSVMTNEIVARSNLGIPVMDDFDDERTVFGVTPQTYPFQGSGIVLYDYGNPWPSPGNHTPVDTMEDPHSRPRREAWHQQQMVTFLRTGEIVDVCSGDGCHPN